MEEICHKIANPVTLTSKDDSITILNIVYTKHKVVEISFPIVVVKR